MIAHEGSGSFELVKIAVKLSDWQDISLYEKDSELEEDWSMQLKDILGKVMNVLNTQDTNLVLHVEERDL